MSRPPRTPVRQAAGPSPVAVPAGLSGGRRSPESPPSNPVRRSSPGIVTLPAWAEHPWLLAGFSTRQGGLSTAYAAGGPPEQNLGYTPEDDPATVAESRRRLVAALAKSHKFSTPPDLITIHQCHSGIIRRVDAAPDGKALLRGDALYTRDPNLLLGILTADCVPVLLADTRTHAIAAFHAGWRGTLARIVERGIGTLRRDFGSRPQDLIAAIGPSIGACCFAIGEEVRDEFDSQFAYAPELFSEVFGRSPLGDPIREKYPMLFLTARAPGHSNLGPQIHMDLWEANRRQLLAAGLKSSSISLIGHCTACTRLRDGRRKYFSHRAEQGFTGRMLSIIGTTIP